MDNKGKRSLNDHLMVVELHLIILISLTKKTSLKIIEGHFFFF